MILFRRDRKLIHLIAGISVNSKNSFGLLTEMDMDKYRLQRRLIGPMYSVSAMKDHESAIRRIVSENVAIMHSKAGESVDIDVWMMCMYFHLHKHQQSILIRNVTDQIDEIVFGLGKFCWP